jgi:hydroxypyruvate isomerase
MPGGARLLRLPRPAETMQETYCENLGRAAAVFSGEGIATLVEPINSGDFPGYYLDSFSEALRLIANIGSPGIRLILDLYHLSVMGQDLHQALTDTHEQVQHVQFADFPGRHEPGTGQLDFAAIVATMRAVGYGGSAGLEYIPTRPVLEPLTLPASLAEYAGLSP